MNDDSAFARLGVALSRRTAVVGVIGLGYVGLPLCMATARASFNVIGFDIDPSKPLRLNAGASYIDGVADAELGEHLRANRFAATDDFERLVDCDVIVICVPTPLTKYRQPDLSYIENSAGQIAKTLRPGQLIILESTTYPGTTREVVKPILDATGITEGQDYFLGFSPEREDPGNASYKTATIPKVVSGLSEQASALAQSFYSSVVCEIVPVSSPEVAEAVKITENIFRAVNIALVNELKVIYDAMGIDVWEVIDAAATKPFGYMPFYPGPGLGGHCIPIDPFYLSWRSRAYGHSTRFVELAGEVNTAMPGWVVNKVDRVLDQRFSIPLSNARILVLGMAYKKNVADIRESPSLKLIELLEERGAKVDYHDPHVPEIPATREHPEFAGRRSTPLDKMTLRSYQAVLIVTDHDAVDYGLVVGNSSLVVDTRNVLARKGLYGDHVVKS